MSYQSLRKLRHFAGLWQDVQGRNPTAVSEAPVAPVAPVNTPYESAVSASGHMLETGGGLFPTILQWNYWPNIDAQDDPDLGPAQNALPATFVWRLDFLIGRIENTAADPLLSVRPFPNAAAADWLVTPIRFPNASVQLNPGEWLPVDQAVFPLWLPWGGSISIGPLVEGDETEIRALATGFLRGSTVNPR